MIESAPIHFASSRPLLRIPMQKRCFFVDSSAYPGKISITSLDNFTLTPFSFKSLLNPSIIPLQPDFGTQGRPLQNAFCIILTTADAGI